MLDKKELNLGLSLNGLKTTPLETDIFPLVALGQKVLFDFDGYIIYFVGKKKAMGKLIIPVDEGVGLSDRHEIKITSYGAKVFDYGK